MAVAVGAVLLVVGGLWGDGAEARRVMRAELTLEQFVHPDTGGIELVVSLREARLNTPDVTGGETSVMLRCVDENREVVIGRRTEWPLLEEYGYPFPHIHQPLAPGPLGRIRACRLMGPGLDFEGRVSGRLPVASP